MNFRIAVLVLFVATQATANTGFYYPGEDGQLKEVASYQDGQAFFDYIVQAQENDEDVEACYEGEFEEAIAVAEKAANGAITFNLIDVYGEANFPPLDLEIYNDKKQSLGAVIHACR